MNSSDTIAAISTPAGVGGIAVVRLSGGRAIEIAQSLMASPTQAVARQAAFSRLVDDGKMIDEAIVTLFPTPHSYTGEDMAEISCHGSLYIQQAVMHAVVKHGARLAEPGEFTLRAFRNGKLNLSQAEAVADLIAASTPAQHSLAISQMRGGYAAELKHLRTQLVELTALLELELDFSEEDVEFADRQRLMTIVATITEKVERLVGSFETGNAFKDGVPIAIVGRPNAGKSSLLNTLIGDERAIVSPIPGTTRDTIEETMTIDGVLFRFIDTAGLRESADIVEQMGFSRALKAVEKAKIILFVRDITTPYNPSADGDIALIADRCDLSQKHLLVVHNKCDMEHQAVADGYTISALDGSGIDHLKQDISNIVHAELDSTDGIMLTNVRHLAAMQAMLASLQQVRTGLRDGIPTDLVAVDLRDTLYHLGTITGEVASSEVLHTIFSRFCIGK